MSPVTHFLDAVKYVTGPLTLVAFIFAILLGALYFFLKTKGVPKYVYELFRSKLTKERFYDLCVKVLNRAFWFMVLLVVLGLVAWLIPTLVTAPNGTTSQQDRNAEDIKSYFDRTAQGITSHQDKNLRDLLDAFGIDTPKQSAVLPWLDKAPLAVREAYEKGQSLVKKGDNASAVLAYNEVIRWKPDSAEGYIIRGTVYRGMGGDRFDDAISDLTEAIRLNPQSFDAYAYRGLTRYLKALWRFCKLQQGEGVTNDKTVQDFTDAISDCSKAIELNQNNVVGYMFRGIIRTATDEDGALDDFTKAILVNPNEPGPTRPKESVLYTLRGVMFYLLKGDESKAIADLTNAIRVNPENGLAYYHRSMVYEAIGDRAKVLDDQHKFMSLLGKKSK